MSDTRFILSTLSVCCLIILYEFISIATSHVVNFKHATFITYYLQEILYVPGAVN